MSFDASASSDSDGTIASYDWDYGDGAAATDAGSQTSHVFAGGTYTVKVTGTDEDGCSAAPVFTGQTSSCSGSPPASQKLVVAGIKVKTVKRNRRAGTATISVQVPAAGDLSLRGKGLESKHQSVDGPGQVSLGVQPRGSAKRKLKQKGKLKVHATLSFTPEGGSKESKSLTIRLKRAG